MPVDVSIALPTLVAFLSVLARVSGMVLFVPIPGFQGSSDTARVVLALALTVMLLPLRPLVKLEPGTGWMIMTMASELSLGMLLGVSMSLLLEGIQVASQIIGLQAGYSFASTIDPSTQADSAVLQVVMQLLSGFLFFALGIDRDLIRILSFRLPQVPIPAQSLTETVIHLGSQTFAFGLRLAMPVLALLVLMDLSFAILNKVHAQFQVMSLSFAAKMLVGLGMSAITLVTFPQLMQTVSNRTFQTLVELLGR